MKLFGRTKNKNAKVGHDNDSMATRKTTADRLDEVLSDDTYKCVVNYKNYIDPTSWMKKHIKEHPQFLASHPGAVMLLPFSFVLKETGIVCSGKCVCDLCGEKFDMTDYENI